MAKNLIVRFSHNFFCQIISICLNFFYMLGKKFFGCYFNSKPLKSWFLVNFLRKSTIFSTSCKTNITNKLILIMKLGMIWCCKKKKFKWNALKINVFCLKQKIKLFKKMIKFFCFNCKRLTEKAFDLNFFFTQEHFSSSL